MSGRRRLINFIISVCICYAYFLTSHGVSESIAADSSYKKVSLKDYSIPGSWHAGTASETAILKQVSSHTFYVTSNLSLGKYPKKSYGAALNLKYFSGLDYNYLRKELPGKTISVDVFIPKESLSRDRDVPNRLRICMKSEQSGEWAEYNDGTAWKLIEKEGLYTFKLKIPETAVEDLGGKIFYPENSILFFIEFFVMDGVQNQPDTYISISNVYIEGIDLDQDALKWQFSKDGYVDTNIFVPSFVKGSAIINSMNQNLKLSRKDCAFDIVEREFQGDLKDAFIEFAAFIPEELRSREGVIELSVNQGAKVMFSAANRMDTADLEGKVRLTLPLGELIADNNSDATIAVSIFTPVPHTNKMLPVVLEPVNIRRAWLVPFDKKWTLRDIQGMGAYEHINVDREGRITDSGVTVTELENDSYQMNATIRLQGGIDWKNPFYRVEFIRELDKDPVDLEDMRLELIISPRSDTTDFWQKPFRARIGLLDESGKVMFGPNVSLSEGLYSAAYLDVSIKQPIPKGFVMPGFDPKKIKSILINVEASHAYLAPRDIEVSFGDLTVSEKAHKEPVPINEIDFSKFKRDPESWQITRLIKEGGGYLVGINYPFPVIDVSMDLMEVPQVYPTVGMKPNDLMHFGFSSDLARKAVIRDFTKFAYDNVNIVRLFVFGHLDGIFNWDEKGKNITGFDSDVEEMFARASSMRAEELAKFLNDNEEKIFKRSADGFIVGLEVHVIKDLEGLLDELQEVEKNTGKRVMVILSLYDFLLGDGIKSEGPSRKFNVGEHPEAVTDPITKVKALSLTWEIMKDLSKDERFYKYVASVEIMNEPDNATALSTREHFNDLVNFVGEGLYLLKDAVGPSMPVTVGFRSWDGDLKYWSSVGEGIDILAPHYWESLESYNIDSPGLWPLDTPVERLWKYLGTESGGRLTGMGEISPRGDFKGNLLRLEKAGYNLTLPWSYSGHDGHSCKPVMSKIKEYQEGNYRFAELKKLPAGKLRIALDFLPNLKALSKKDISSYITKISDENIRRTVRDVTTMMSLKGMSPDEENVLYLRAKLLGEKAPVITAEAPRGAPVTLPAPPLPMRTPGIIREAPGEAPVALPAPPLPMKAPFMEAAGQKLFHGIYPQPLGILAWKVPIQFALLFVMLMLIVQYINYRRQQSPFANIAESDGMMTSADGQTVAIPYNGREMRRFPRYDYQEPLRYGVFGETGPENITRKLVSALLKNISVSGALFESKYPPPGPAAILAMDFDYKHLPVNDIMEKRNEKFRNRLLARVVRAETNADGTFSVGVEFLQKGELETVR